MDFHFCGYTRGSLEFIAMCETYGIHRPWHGVHYRHSGLRATNCQPHDGRDLIQSSQIHRLQGCGAGQGSCSTNTNHTLLLSNMHGTNSNSRQRLLVYFFGTQPGGRTLPSVTTPILTVPISSQPWWAFFLLFFLFQAFA